ncbi:Macrophage colony-stimulating factor 1 receptor [Cladophialophora chaetospira]|uniref:Macrophage colony-stimulating factor 1 receptor n=1 Tax=Cladophialophora chaetospira TaxID=386627 RepID=A0AA39CHH9_9EURO|nr:Macrophage colony-stimulating factor 1 receptor [Cladophialophora chaetospira]
MSDLSDLVGEPISTNTSFNWTWFVELATCACLTLFFLFYFNRLFATLVSYGIRAWTWHKYRAWIDIQSLQLSFLAGRIFFKGLRYHAENETVLIQSGYITWRYWQSSSRQVDLSSSDDEEKDSLLGKKEEPRTDASDGSDSPSPDPELGRVKGENTADARISVVIAGLEWFVYNRTPVYEAIVQDVLIHEVKNGSSDSQASAQKPERRLPKLHRHTDSTRPQSKDANTSDNSAESPLTEKNAHLSTTDEVPVPVARVQTFTSMTSGINEPAADVPAFYSWILRVLPVAVECSKGAISLGNENTRALVVTTFASAKGLIDAEASGSSDIFRQVFDFEIEKPKIEMRPNPDFRRSQYVAAERIISAAESLRHRPRWWHINLGLRRRMGQFLRALKRMFPGSSRGSLRTTASQEGYGKKLYAYEEFQDDNRSWHGLGRYMDEDERDDHEGWSHIEYARFSQILDSPGIHFRFFWDMPGSVTQEHADSAAYAGVDDINMSKPPAYGMDLNVRGGSLNYGPWADRLRLEIQTAFLPNAYRSVSPASQVKVGEPRQYTIMSIRVDLEDEVSLRVPARERSKDWQWRNRAHAVIEAAAARKQREKRHFRFRRSTKTKLGPDIRPFGWLTVSAGQDSTVRYDMDMTPRAEGYRNLLHLDLKHTKATSSVNHALLWRCPSQRVSCDLSNPLTWNGLHTWEFDVESNAMEMFILRDHMIMLTDLVSDFTAGLKADYMTFVPFIYRLHVKFPNLKLYLNANDYNIIDNPNDLEENAFLVLGFQTLAGDVNIPMQYFSPRQSAVEFIGEGHNASLELITPVWSTLNTLAEDTTMMTLKQLNLEGSYNYYPDVSPKLTDSLFMTITGYAPKLFLHGYLIRYFINVKENYFGEDLHFRTLEEYQDMLAGNEPQGPRPGSKKENDLDVILTVRADSVAVLMPANIYSRRENLRVDILLAEADMRFTNYYMDLQVNSSPLEASIESISMKDNQPSSEITSCQLFIDGVGVYGHRLFGAPPLEPTYACHWDLNVGEIAGECTSTFIQTLINAVMAFIYNLDDDENSLPPFNRTAIHDVVFLRANLAGLRLWLVAGAAAYMLEVSEADVSFHDWANSCFAKELRANVPRIAVAAVDYKGALRHQDRGPGPVETFACFETSLRIGTLDKTDNLAHTRALQQQHIRYHDQRTHRTDWLLDPRKHYPPTHKLPEWARDPPAMPVPSMPEPVGSVEKTTFPGSRDKFGRTKANRNSSFLSIQSLNKQVSSDSRRPHQSSRNHTTSRTSFVNESAADQSRTVNRPRPQHQDAHQTMVTFASPWAPPHFTLHDVQPDTKNMPQLPDQRRSNFPSLTMPSNEDPDVKTDDFEGTPHNGVVFMVQNGLSGFCSPSLFLSIAVLIRELGTNSPVDQLDKVQITVMKRILETHKHDDNGHIVDFAVRIPFAHIRLINSVATDVNAQAAYHDQYDVKLTGSQMMYRLLHPKTHRPGLTTPYGQLAYGSIQNLSVSVRDDAFAPGRPSAQTAITLANVGLWFSMKEEINSKLQLSNFDVVLWAERLHNMAALIQRTVAMVDRIVVAFDGLDQSYKSRHLIYHLTQAGTAIADPVFLTRPSYVLRSADKHVRLSDSWKIISRLRYIFATTEKDKGRDFIEKCGCTDLELKDPDKRQVLSSFEQWRGWDYARDKVPIMSTLFETPGTQTPDAPYNNLIVHSEIIIGKLGLILDPGPRQSDLAVLGLDFNVILRRGASSGIANNAQRVILQAYTADTALHLNWALVELAKQVIELGNPLALGTSRSDASVEHIRKSLDTRRNHFTVVVGSDAASIHLTTINLKLKWAAESFRSAFSFSEGDSGPTVSSFTIAANTAMAKIRGQLRTLMLWRIRMPKLYGSIWPQTMADTEIQKLIVQICAASNRLRFQMKEDVTKLLHVADSVIQDEVAAIVRLVDQIPKAQDESQKAKPTTEPAGLNMNVELRLAMFLDDYKLNFAILPSLQYAIAGDVARTSIIPRREGGLDINLDIKEHEHLFEVSQGMSMDNLPVLTMPPINGHISVIPTSALISVRARMTLEQINLEASGVRACFDALNQPGVVQLIPNTKSAVQQIQHSVNQVMGSKSKPETARQEESTLLLRYAIHGTLAGIKIHFSAPSVREDHNYRADMELKLRATTLFIHNETDSSVLIHERPQFILNTQGVALGLFRTTRRTRESFGMLSIGMKASGKTETVGNVGQVQVYRAWSDGLSVELYEETATLAVDIVAFLQERIKSMKLADRDSNIHHIRRMTTAGLTDRLKPKEQLLDTSVDGTESIGGSSTVLYDSTYALDLGSIIIRWNLTGNTLLSPGREIEDLVFSIRKVDLKTRQEGTARLSISDTQLQMVPKSQYDTPTVRTANSALLPEVVFGTAYLSTKHERRFAFQAKGKALDLRLAADFIIPGHALQKSFGNASTELRNAKAIYESSPATPQAPPIDLLGGKRLASLLVDADFAGAVVHISPRNEVEHKRSAFGFLKGPKRSRAGRYGQAVQGENVSTAILKSPGVALKVEFKDDNKGDPSLSTEVRVSASSNTLFPTVVPLILEISSSVKEILGDDQVDSAVPDTPAESRSYLSDTALSNPSPDAIFGRCKLNAGLYIQPQEFSLSCQPIARVAATAKFADIFVRIDTVSAPDQERFFAILTTFNKLEASVQHVYSRESTASFEVDSIVMSLMNSKHVSSATGISAVLNVSPMKTDINAKQLQDFLLFREIWYPPELRTRAKPSAATSPLDQQAYAMQRYQELSGKGTLPWHAIISMQELQLKVDFGQGLGKSVFTVSKLWASSRKNSDSEQNLCIGFDRVGIDSTGRMSGFIELENMRARTSIHWPEDTAAKTRAPLVQASIGFEHFRIKAAFDYQPFAVADISSFEFLMYNVRQGHGNDSDRLVGIVNGGKVQVFCTTGTAAQGLALVQAFERLVQEKQEAYESSLRDLDKFLRRKSMFPTSSWTAPVPSRQDKEGAVKRGTFALHTDVVVALGALDVGVFPNTFFDNQLLKVEATDVQARFAVATTEGKTHSGLGMTLGQLRVALSSVNRATTKALSEVSVPDVIDRATSSGGGTIVKVPRLVSSMQTWQVANSNTIEYTFRSVFEGKVDVGWNYARISFIRGMWQTHSRALAQRLGKPLPPSAIKVTAEPATSSSSADGTDAGTEKITAVVNVPQSKFTYVPLEPPIIDTPQLRDMGEATPPLEWIGLHRDKLPEATHSVAIVSLLEVAREVEDAYTRILGAS